MTSLPNIPPPLPPPPILTPSKPGIYTKNAKFRVSSDEFQLPPAATELRLACRNAGLINFRSGHKEEHKDELRSHLLCHYNQVKPLIQDGPRCGLVALCMASQLVCKKTINTEDVFCLCKERGYTQNGEMFSAAAMCDTAKAMCFCEVMLIQDVSSSEDTIVNHLMRGLPVLFPYDADKNHGPGNRQGHAAHWAVLTGVVIQSCCATDVIEKFYSKDSEEDCIYHIKNTDCVPTLHDLHPCTVHVCCRQGKSNHMRLWQLSDMVTSSCQMEEISKEVLTELRSTVLPGRFVSLQNDLANKAICLTGSN